MKNMKMSFIFQKPIINKDECTTGKINFKRNTATVTIYKHKTTLVNVTGIKSMEEIATYRHMLEEEFKQPIIEERIEYRFYVLLSSR